MDGWSIYEKPSSGAGTASSYIETPRAEWPTDWSTDGQWVIMGVYNSDTKFDVEAYSTTASDTIMVANSEFQERVGKLSPDGNWIAYYSDESGKDEVYVQSFPEAQGKWQISTRGGLFARWSADGTELFYTEPGGQLMAVEMSTEAGFHAGTPKELFAPEAGNFFLASRDGSRFLFAKPLRAAKNAPMTVVVNWAAELAGR